MFAAYPAMSLRAIAFKVIVEPEREASDDRLITIVKSAKDSFRIGRVLSVGAVAKEKVPELEPGVRVLYAQSVACTNACEDRHIVHHDHVLCIVAEGETLRDLDPVTHSAPQVQAHGPHQ
jgi:hypothetical protein